MRNPHIVEVTNRFEYITNRHSDELYRSMLYWREIKTDGTVVQLVPIIDLKFKF